MAVTSSMKLRLGLWEQSVGSGAEKNSYVLEGILNEG